MYSNLHLVSMSLNQNDYSWCEYRNAERKTSVVHRNYFECFSFFSHLLKNALMFKSPFVLLFLNDGPILFVMKRELLDSV